MHLSIVAIDECRDKQKAAYQSPSWPTKIRSPKGPLFWCTLNLGVQAISFLHQDFAGTSPNSHRQIDAWAFPPSCALTFSHFINTSWFLPSLFLPWQPLIVPPSTYSPKSITPCLLAVLSSPSTPTWHSLLQQPKNLNLETEAGLWAANLSCTIGAWAPCYKLQTDFANRFCLNQL